MSFIDSEKHAFKLPKKTDLPIFVFESGKIDSRILAASKSGAKGRVAEGTCHKARRACWFSTSPGDDSSVST